MASLSSVADRCHRHYVTEWSDDRRGNAWDSERGVRSSLRQYPEHDHPLTPQVVLARLVDSELRHEFIDGGIVHPPGRGPAGGQSGPVPAGGLLGE